MKKIDVAQTLSILANLGVIAGIIFLGFELRQNNTLMASQSRANQTEQVLALQSEVFLNADLAEIIYKASMSEPRTGADQLRLLALQPKMILGMQFQFEELRNGTLDRVNVAAWRAIYRGEFATVPVPIDKGWDDLKDVLRPEFREFFEANVLAE
jgi:hypothetical protein